MRTCAKWKGVSKMARVTDSKEWFETWYEDKQSMVCTMIKNLTSDLEAGYNPFGNSIRNQRAEIDRYTIQFEKEMDAFIQKQTIF